MQISWHGLGCIRLQTKDLTLFIDPFSSTVGLPAPRLQADCFVFTSSENPQLSIALKGQSFVVSHAGEFEIRGVVLMGSTVEQTVNKKLEIITLYTVAAEGLVLGHLGALARPLTEMELEHLENVDVLFLPVGGKSVLGADQASEVISQIEPRVVIPMHYQLPGLKVPLDGVDKFAKALGVKNAAPQDKIRLSRKDLPEEDMSVIILKP